jgi:hypothetical protein
MKQQDVLYLIGAVVVGIIVSAIASKIFFNTPKNLSQQVEVVPTISTSFQVPSSQYFNSQSIDPTQIINIGPNNNQTVF